MKVIIAGSRGVTDYGIIALAVYNAEIIGIDITEVVSGTAAGVDRLGEQYALAHDIKIKKFPANWNKYNKQAGYIRNKEMAEYADASIIIWDGKSKGTKHMINLSEEYKLLNYLVKV